MSTPKRFPHPPKQHEAPDPACPIHAGESARLSWTNALTWCICPEPELCFHPDAYKPEGWKGAHMRCPDCGLDFEDASADD